MADRFSGWFRQVSRRRLIRTPLTTRDLPLRSGDGARPGGNRPSNGRYGKLAAVGEQTTVRTVSSSEAMEPVDEETPMIDFREQFIERLNPNQDGFNAMPPSGQAKVYRAAGCWVYQVNADQEREFRQWVTDHLGLPELGRVKVHGDFPMLQVVSPLDSPFD